MLGTRALTYEQAAQFIFEAAGLADTHGLSVISSPETAFRFAEEQNWLSKRAAPADKVQLQEVSLLLMQSFGIKGGLFYSLLKNPHFAYRELVYQEVIQGMVDREMMVSGDLMLFLVGRILSLQETEIESAIDREQRRIAAEAEQRRRAEEAEHRRQERLAARQALTERINIELAAQEVSDTSARVTDYGITISLSNIQFLANSAEIPAEERRKLNEIAGILRAIPMRNILITGHTALAGTEQDRMRTSLERAQAVRAYLVSLGVRTMSEISVDGFGSRRPVADNTSPQGMALNRRVEITILEDQ